MDLLAWRRMFLKKNWEHGRKGPNEEGGHKNFKEEIGRDLSPLKEKKKRISTTSHLSKTP